MEECAARAATHCLFRGPEQIDGVYWVQHTVRDYHNDHLCHFLVNSLARAVDLTLALECFCATSDRGQHHRQADHEQSIGRCHKTGKQPMHRGKSTKTRQSR